MTKFEMCDSCKQNLEKALSDEYGRELWHDPIDKLPLEGQPIRFEYLLSKGLGRALLPNSYKGIYRHGKFEAVVCRRRNSVFVEYNQFEEGESTTGYQQQTLSKGPNLIYRWIEI